MCRLIISEAVSEMQTDAGAGGRADGIECTKVREMRFQESQAMASWRCPRIGLDLGACGGRRYAAPRRPGAQDSLLFSPRLASPLFWIPLIARDPRAESSECLSFVWCRIVMSENHWCTVVRDECQRAAAARCARRTHRVGAVHQLVNSSPAVLLLIKSSLRGSRSAVCTNLSINGDA